MLKSEISKQFQNNHDWREFNALMYKYNKTRKSLPQIEDEIKLAKNLLIIAKRKFLLVEHRGACTRNIRQLIVQFNRLLGYWEHRLKTELKQLISC